MYLSTRKIVCTCGHLHVVLNFVEANVNKKTDDGDTGVHYASKHGHLPVVEYLVQLCHANIDETNLEGKTAYELAHDSGHDDIATFLNEWKERQVVETNDEAV